MRSPFSLGIVFLGLAAFCIFGVPDIKPSAVAYVLAGMLAISGALVMTRMPVAYYIALVTSAAVTVGGILGWAHIGGGRLGLPIHYGFEIFLGLYMGFRTAISHRMFGPQPARKVRLEEALEENYYRR